MKAVKELKRLSSNERRDESVRLNDASFESEFMFVEFDSHKTCNFVRTF